MYISEGASKAKDRGLGGPAGNSGPTWLVTQGKCWLMWY